MHKTLFNLGLATAALLTSSIALTHSAAAQQEIRLTVAAGQPLRAMV